MEGCQRTNADDDDDDNDEQKYHCLHKCTFNRPQQNAERQPAEVN